MLEHIDMTNKINPFQSGFRHGYNTTGLVLDISENIRSNMDKGWRSLLIALDFSKAFDSISHRMLCFKLQNYFNFGSSSCRLISSFLVKRLQYVESGGIKSSTREIFRGVPQESILGPLLFTMYLNDIYDAIKFCKCYTYADDIQLMLC